MAPVTRVAPAHLLGYDSDLWGAACLACPFCSAGLVHYVRGLFDVAGSVVEGRLRRHRFDPRAFKSKPSYLDYWLCNPPRPRLTR